MDPKNKPPENNEPASNHQILNPHQKNGGSKADSDSNKSSTVVGGRSGVPGNPAVFGGLGGSGGSGIPSSRIVDWRDCATDLETRGLDDLRVRLPGFPAPCELKYPAICVHVRIDPRISLGVPYIVNRQMLMRRTLHEYQGIEFVNFEHRHALAAAKCSGQYISAGVFICHHNDILVVEGWRYCEAKWYSASNSRDMANQGFTARDLWPWVGRFPTVSLQ